MMRKPANQLMWAVWLIPMLGAGCGGNKPPRTVAVVTNGPGVSQTPELNRAINLAVRAVEQYERQEPEHALVSLRMAEEVVRPMAQGEGVAPLAMLSARLPGDYRRYDLRKLKSSLESQVRAEGKPSYSPVPASSEPEEPLSAEGGRPLIQEGTLLDEPDAFASTAAYPGGVQPRSVRRHDVDDETFVRQELDRLMAEFGETSYEPPADFMAELEKTIRYFQTEKHDFFQNSLNRSSQYAPMIEKIFKKSGVPADMAYMAFIESGFRPDAISHAGARGLWQFMPGTAKQYGLRVGRSSDERLEPVPATLAAREYFLDLLSIFGTRSWLLAMAAYNAGENKIAACLKRIEDPFEQRTFWHIRECLREETQDYVPRILAAAIMSADPARFGFDPPPPAQTQPFETVALPGYTTVQALAQAAGVGADQLYDLNPDLDPTQPGTPAASSARPYRLNVPVGTGSQIIEEWAALVEAGRMYGPSVARRVEPEPRPAQDWAVRASKEGTSRRGSSGKGGGQTAQKKGKQAQPSYFLYKVASGNTVAEIAQAFGVGSYKELLRWNSMKRPTVQANQQLKIYKPFRRIQYTVRKGDTLDKVARKFGTSTQKIMFFNGLKQKKIKPGASLLIYVAAK